MMIQTSSTPSLVGLQPLLDDARKGGYAVGAFSYCNAEMAEAVVDAGIRLRSPVMFIVGPVEIPLVGVDMLVEIARHVARHADVPVCLHLDHAVDVELIAQCIEAGFPSVMIDGSQHGFEENMRLTRAVVEMAHARGVTVEGELGAVGRADDASVEGSHEATLTDPTKAAEFAERTGVDALAVAIGNAHGIYPQRPELDFALLEAIRNATGVPLVLHGGSCTPWDQLHRAIELGITKVNVASELSRAFLAAVREPNPTGPMEGWYSNVLLRAKSAVSEVVERWMSELGSVGRSV